MMCANPQYNQVAHIKNIDAQLTISIRRIWYFLKCENSLWLRFVYIIHDFLLRKCDNPQPEMI